MKSSKHLPQFPDHLKILVLEVKFQTRKLTFSAKPGAHSRIVDEVSKSAQSKLWQSPGMEVKQKECKSQCTGHYGKADRASRALWRD